MGKSKLTFVKPLWFLLSGNDYEDKYQEVEAKAKL